MFLIQNLTPPKKAANLTWPCLALHHLHSRQWHRHSLAVQPLAHRSVYALLPPIENHWNVSKTSTLAFPSHVHGQLASDFYCSPAKSQLQFQFVEHVDPVWLCRYAFLPPKLDSTFRLCSGYATMRFCGQHGCMIQILDHCHTLLLHILRRCYTCIMYKIPIHIRTCHMHIHIRTCTCTYCPIQYIFDDYHTWIGINQETLLFFLLWKDTELKKREMCSKHIFLLDVYRMSFSSLPEGQQCLCRIYEVLHPVLSAGNSCWQNVPFDVLHQWITMMSLPIFSIHGEM